MRAERVFDGALLRADLFKGDRRRLFVSFRQRVGAPGTFEDARPVRAYTAKGYAHLHIQSRWNDWFVNAETPALEAALRALAPRYLRAVALGFSMGGYGALRFSSVLGLAQVIAVAGQRCERGRRCTTSRQEADKASGPRRLARRVRSQKTTSRSRMPASLGLSSTW